MPGSVLSRSLGAVGLVACCLGGSAATASADPIVVTSGRLDFGRGGNFASFKFAGADGFELSATALPTALAVPSCALTPGATGCRPGDTLNLSLVVGSGSGVNRSVLLPAAFTLGSGQSATVNGTVFAPNVSPNVPPFPGPLGLAGTLRIDAPPIVLSEANSVFNSPFTFGSRFVLSGNVTGFAINDVVAQHPLFDVSLTGGGTMFVDFEEGLFNGIFREAVIHVNFDASPAPTPEPATLLLLGTALVGVAARTRRKLQNP